MNRVFMGVSVLTRMGVSLVVLVMLARLLGPRDYGFVATVFAGATLTSLLTDFGLATRTLRDIAANPAAGYERLTSSLSVKIYLTLVVFIVGCLIASYPQDAPALGWAALLLGGAVLVGTVGELSLTAYRAFGRYAAETWVTVWTSLVHLLVVGVTAILFPNVVSVGIAFLTSRLFFTVIAVRGSMRLFPGKRLVLSPIRHSLTVMRSNLGWALDNGLNYVSGQIDGIIVAFLFGLSAAGVYQAAGRFAQAGLGLVAIFANVHIPRLAAHKPPSRNGLTSSELRMMLEVTIAGALLGGGMTMVGPFITLFLLGDAYRAADQLWLGMGAFVFLRYLVAAGGIRLTARNEIRLRVWGQVAGLVCFAVLSAALLPKSGYAIVPWIASASTAVVAIVYLSSLIAKKGLKHD